MPEIQIMPLMKKREKLLAFLLLAFLAFIFLLAHSINTSPLFITLYSDSETFIVMGKLFLRGEVPYIDFFDHKGPIIIFIEALALQLHPDNRTAVFIFQFILLLILLCFMYKMLRRYVNEVKSMIIILLTMCYYAPVYCNGNLTEEYSLLFIFLPFYYTLRFLFEKEYTLKPIKMLIIGLCCGVLIWLRLNNMAVVCACLLLFFIDYCLKKDWLNLVKLVGFVSLGVLIISVPILLYFYSLNSLDELLYATFTFNFKYAENARSFGGDALSLQDIVRLVLLFSIPFFVLLMGTISFYKKNRDSRVMFFSLFLIVITLVATLVGLSAPHYLIVALPLIMLGGLYWFLSVEKVSQKKAYFLFILLSLVFIGLAGLKIKQNKGKDVWEAKHTADIVEVLSKIPIDERDNLYAYATSTSFINVAGIKPYIKYIFSQERHGATDPVVFEEINHMMEVRPPKWLVEEYRGRYYNPEFHEIKDEKYDLYFQNETFDLYKLK